MTWLRTIVATVLLACRLVMSESGQQSESRVPESDHTWQEQLRQAIRDRSTALPTVGHYVHRINYTPPYETLTAEGKLHRLRTGLLLRQEVYSRMGSGFRYEYRIDMASISRLLEADDFDYRSYVLNILQSRTELLVENPTQKVGNGLIADSRAIPNDFLFDLALGTRLYGQSPAAFRQHVADMQFEKLPDSKIRALIVTPGGLKHRWILDPQRQYALLSYEVDAVESTFLQIEVKDWEVQREMNLPKAIEARRVTRVGDRNHVAMRHLMEEFRYEWKHLPETAEAPALLVWPAGTWVTDERIGELFIIQGHAKPLNDSTIFEVLKTRSQREALLRERTDEEMLDAGARPSDAKK